MICQDLIWQCFIAAKYQDIIPTNIEKDAWYYMASSDHKDLTCGIKRGDCMRNILENIMHDILMVLSQKN